MPLYYNPYDLHTGARDLESTLPVYRFPYGSPMYHRTAYPYAGSYPTYEPNLYEFPPQVGNLGHRGGNGRPAQAHPPYPPQADLRQNGRGMAGMGMPALQQTAGRLRARWRAGRSAGPVEVSVRLRALGSAPLRTGLRCAPRLRCGAPWLSPSGRHGGRPPNRPSQSR